MSTMIEFENVSRIYKSGDHELKALDNLSLKMVHPVQVNPPY